jgi:hypothetical protein
MAAKGPPFRVKAVCSDMWRVNFRCKTAGKMSTLFASFVLAGCLYRQSNTRRIAPADPSGSEAADYGGGFLLPSFLLCACSVCRWRYSMFVAEWIRRDTTTPTNAHTPSRDVCALDRVKSPNYPKALAPAFSALEQEGKLVPTASTDVENLTGTGRIYRQRQEIRVILLEVRE